MDSKNNNASVYSELQVQRSQISFSPGVLHKSAQKEAKDLVKQKISGNNKSDDGRNCLKSRNRFQSQEKLPDRIDASFVEDMLSRFDSFDKKISKLAEASSKDAEFYASIKSSLATLTTPVKIITQDLETQPLQDPTNGGSNDQQYKESEREEFQDLVVPVVDIISTVDSVFDLWVSPPVISEDSNISYFPAQQKPTMQAPLKQPRLSPQVFVFPTHRVDLEPPFPLLSPPPEPPPTIVFQSPTIILQSPTIPCAQEFSSSPQSLTSQRYTPSRPRGAAVPGFGDGKVLEDSRSSFATLDGELLVKDVGFLLNAVHAGKPSTSRPSLNPTSIQSRPSAMVRPHSDKSYKPKLLDVPTIVAPKLAHVMDGSDRILPEDAPVRFPLKSIAPVFGLRSIVQDVLVLLAPRNVFDPGTHTSRPRIAVEVPKFFPPRRVFDPGRSSHGIVVFAKSSPKLCRWQYSLVIV